MDETVTGASPSEGSSSMRSRGRAISARPIAVICCSPPESVPASCRRRSARSGKSANTRSSVSPRRRRLSALRAPSSRFSSTVIVGKSWRPSGTWAIPPATTAADDSPLIRRPSSSTVPRRSGRRPQIARSVVVLPAPFEPISATISPWRTSSETPRMAVMSP